MLRRTLRRLRLALFALITTVIIALALLMGFDAARDAVARAQSRAYRSVAFRTPAAAGHDRRRQRRVGRRRSGADARSRAHRRQRRAQAPLEIPRAELALSFYAPFKRGLAWSEFRMVGVDVESRARRRRRLAPARIRCRHGARSRRRPQMSAPQELSMGVLGVLVLKDFKLAIDDPSKDLHLGLGASELRVVNLGATTHIAGKVRNLAGDPTPIDLIADLDLAAATASFMPVATMSISARFTAARPFDGVELAERPRRCADLDRGERRARRGGAPARGSARCDVRGARCRSRSRRRRCRAAHAFRSRRVRRALAARGCRLDDRCRRFRGHRGSGASQRAGRLTIERTRRGRQPALPRGRPPTRLEPLGGLAMLSSAVPEGVRHWLYLAHPRGELSRADLRWNNADDFDATPSPARGRVRQRELRARHRALRYRAAWRRQRLLLDFRSRRFASIIRACSASRSSVPRSAATSWRIAPTRLARRTDRFVFEGEGYGGEFDGGVEIQDDHTRPLLDLYAVVSHAE